MIFPFITEYKKVTIVSDSMAKYVTGIEGVQLQACRGDTFSRIANRLSRRQIILGKFDYVIFHVGTNDIAQDASFDHIISDNCNLIGIIRKFKPKIKLLPLQFFLVQWIMLRP